jgi:hypothetical protein
VLTLCLQGHFTFSFLGTSLIRTNCPYFLSVLATVRLIWRRVLLRMRILKFEQQKKCTLFWSVWNLLWFYWHYERAWFYKYLLTMSCKGQILEPNDPRIQYSKYCDVSCPDLQLSMLWFYQNSSIVQISNIQEVILMCDLLRLQISSNFLFYIFIHIEIFISFVGLLCPNCNLLKNLYYTLKFTG